MRHLRYSESAESDIIDIIEYISVHNSSVVAERFTAELQQRCLQLASMPGLMGRARPTLGVGIRSRAFGNYIIYLKYMGSTMRIVRILEAHRDISSDDMNEGD